MSNWFELLVKLVQIIAVAALFHLFPRNELKGSGVVGPILAGSVAAFLGAFIGSRLLHKVTLKTIQTIITILLILLAIALGTGII